MTTVLGHSLCSRQRGIGSRNIAKRTQPLVSVSISSRSLARTMAASGDKASLDKNTSEEVRWSPDVTRHIAVAAARVGITACCCLLSESLSCQYTFIFILYYSSVACIHSFVIVSIYLLVSSIALICRNGKSCCPLKSTKFSGSKAPSHLALESIMTLKRMAHSCAEDVGLPYMSTYTNTA